MLSNKMELYIDDLPLRDVHGDHQCNYLQGIPATLLVSLKMATPVPPLTTRLHWLKQVLLNSRRLEIFHYDDRGQGTQFSFAEKERLPPLKELSLRSYDWNHSAKDVADHWDFSMIRHLALVDVPLYQFLASVPCTMLLKLHTLHCEDFSAHLTDRRRDATRQLYMLVSQVRALHTLRITCHTQLFPVDALLRHARTLRVMSFRDYVGFGDEERRCPTICIDDLVSLSHGLPNLHTLELDMDAASCVPSLFLGALCRFPQLHTLTLHVQTVLRSYDAVRPGTDRDCDSVLATIRALVWGKQGGVPWTCVTINVGGWGRHMTRRLGGAWREKNEQGVYAERCFVLERGPRGEMRFREERAAVESPTGAYGLGQVYM
jgi:hypothetical protein